MTINEGPIHQRTETIGDTPPVVQQPGVQYAQPEVVAVAPATAGQVSTAYTSRFAPDAVIAALVGLALLLLGLIAIVRGGFDGEMSDPVVEVLGFTHTTTLGLIEAAIGLCLLIAGATRSRAGAVFFGAVLGVAGFVGAVQAESFDESLALESSLAWLFAIAGAVVVLAALLMPRFAKQSTVIEHI